MRFAPFILTIGLAPAALSAQQPAQPPDALARALQQRYERVLDFSADFVQTYRGGALRTQARERGTVTIKKPGLMRWVYSDPEKKEIVSDGRKLYMYFPADRQVAVSDVPPDNEASTAALFLAGKGDISRDFTATYAESAIPGAVALKLVPRREQPDYEHLVVTLDPATLQIRALTTLDRLGGNSTLTFTNMKENRRLSDKQFVFPIPRGAKVVSDGTRN